MVRVLRRRRQLFRRPLPGFSLQQPGLASNPLALFSLFYLFLRMLHWVLVCSLLSFQLLIHLHLQGRLLLCHSLLRRLSQHECLRVPQPMLLLTVLQLRALERARRELTLNRYPPCGLSSSFAAWRSGDGSFCASWWRCCARTIGAALPGGTGGLKDTPL